MICFPAKMPRTGMTSQLFLKLLKLMGHYNVTCSQLNGINEAFNMHIFTFGYQKGSILLRSTDYFAKLPNLSTDMDLYDKVKCDVARTLL